MKNVNKIFETGKRYGYSKARAHHLSENNLNVCGWIFCAMESNKEFEADSEQKAYEFGYHIGTLNAALVKLAENNKTFTKDWIDTKKSLNTVEKSYNKFLSTVI